MYKIYFPLFDHSESASNEMRLTHEGLVAHPRVTLVDRPEDADYLIFCQNHLVDHCPFHPQFRPLKDRYKEKTILLDYDDDPGRIVDADDFRWRLYFKRSCVDRVHGRVMDYGGRAVIPTAYCVVDAMVEPPAGHTGARPIDVSCLFDDYVTDCPWFQGARGRLLTFAKRLSTTRGLAMQVGPVSDSGQVGRSAIDPKYKRCLYDSKIVLHANPDPWEGDARTWEALASGALVFVDRLRAPIRNPLLDGQHLVFYDLTDEGMNALERQIVHYLDDERERTRIGTAGRAFVLKHHRSINRVSGIIDELERTDPLARRPAALPRDPQTTPAQERATPRTHDRVTPSTPDLAMTHARDRAAPPRALDIVVTIATGYTDVGVYRRFVATLRRTGARCPVFVGISDGPEYEPVRRYLLENAVNYFIVPPITPAGKVQNGYRFEQYRQWLRDLEFRYALMMDIRDAFFQRDPFMDAEAFMEDCDLYLMSEFQLLTVGNHPNGMNYAWVAEPFGTPAADAIADQVILNAGAIVGRRSAVMAFLETVADVTARQDFEFNEQGTLNYLAHTGRLNHCGRIKITRAGESVVNNCGFSEIDLLRNKRPISQEEEARIAFIPRSARGRLQLYRDHEGWVLDDDGNVSYVVHQYDRFLPEVGEIVSRLSDYQHPDEVFINSGQRPYRGEKYTLSSRDGLTPDAVQRLVEKIKGMDVGTKPLLVLDTTFRRGFVFAYGVLNNELLFLSEAFRREFFEPTGDTHKCDWFCRRWGYRAVVVEEREIFQTVVG